MLSPHQSERFLQEYWSQEVFIDSISSDDFDALRSELSQFDAISLIRSHTGPVASVWFEDSNGYAQAVDMTPAEAAKFYDAGMTVFLPDISTPTVERWRAELATTLSRPPRMFLCSLFLSKGGNVTGCHFDHIENFTVQLRGEKKWRMMKNLHAPLPTVNYSTRTARPYSEELWLYSDKSLHADMGGVESRTLEPGSLLYIPRGTWHEVEAAADSISLLLGLASYTWLDVILPSLRTMLLRHVEWRDNAIYPHNAESWRAAHDRLAELCKNLSDFLREQDPAEFLPHITPSPNDRGIVFRRNPLCTLGLYETADNQLEAVASVHQGELSRRRETTIPDAWGPAVMRIDCSEELTETDLVRQFPQLAAQVPRILDVFVKLEVIYLATKDVREAAQLQNESFWVSSAGPCHD